MIDLLGLFKNFMSSGGGATTTSIGLPASENYGVDPINIPLGPQPQGTGTVLAPGYTPPQTDKRAALGSALGGMAGYFGGEGETPSAPQISIPPLAQHSPLQLAPVQDPLQGFIQALLARRVGMGRME